MIYIIVNITEINKLNEIVEGKQLSPRQTINEENVLCADILTDEDTWGFAFEYLNSCEQIELTIDDFPKIDLFK